MNIIEDVLSVPRNYWLLSPLFRILVCLRVVSDVFLNITDLWFHMTHKIVDYRLTIVYSTGQVFSFLIVLLSLYYSKKYKTLLEYVTKNHHELNKDKLYMENLQRYFNTVKIIITCFFVIHLCLFSTFIVIQKQNIDLLWLFNKYNMLSIFMRYVLQYFMMCTYLCIISEQVKFITRRISTVKSLVFTVSQELEPHELDLTSFTKLINNYLNIKEISCLFNTIYGSQVSTVFF